MAPPKPSPSPSRGTPSARDTQRIEESQRLVLRALQRRVDEGRFSVDDAVAVAMVQLSRPAGPPLGAEQKRAVERALVLLARQLEPPSPRALHTFAREAAHVAWQAVREARSPGAVVNAVAAGIDTAAIARAAVYAELLHARDDEDLLHRAVTRGLNERRRGRPGVAVPLAPGDPLRGLLDLPARGHLRLPRRDVRGTIARVAVDNAALGDTLRKAARFAREVLEPALGAELWLLCRPVGFVDRKETRVLIATEHSLGAQETQLRSRELVHRLRPIAGFAQVEAAKVVVDARAFRGEPVSTSPR